MLASHSVPAGASTLEEIESRRLGALSGTTGSRSVDRIAVDLLRSVFGERADAARYLVSHEVGGEAPTEHLGANLVLIGKRRRLVAALVRPGARDLEVHVVPEH